MITYDFRTFLARFTDDVDDLPIFAVIEALPKLSDKGPWLAGGAVRRTLLGQEPESDFDIFFASPVQETDFIERLEREGATEIATTEHHRTFRFGEGGWIIQCINFAYYESPEAVLDSFDFTICQFATDGQTLWCGDHSLWDLARKRLALHKVTFGTSTMRRLIKYTRQGFTACGGTMADLLERIVENPAAIHREVEYVD